MRKHRHRGVTVSGAWGWPSARSRGVPPPLPPRPARTSPSSPTALPTACLPAQQAARSLGPGCPLLGGPGSSTWPSGVRGGGLPRKPSLTPSPQQPAAPWRSPPEAHGAPCPAALGLCPRCTVGLRPGTPTGHLSFPAPREPTLRARFYNRGGLSVPQDPRLCVGSTPSTPQHCGWGRVLVGAGLDPGRREVSDPAGPLSLSPHPRVMLGRPSSASCRQPRGRESKATDIMPPLALLGLTR